MTAAETEKMCAFLETKGFPKDRVYNLIKDSTYAPDTILVSVSSHPALANVAFADLTKEYEEFKV